MSSRKFSLLYVDDEPSNLSIFKNTFRRDYRIFTAASAKEGLEILKNEQIDLVLSDQRMPEMSGVEFLKKAIDLQPAPNRILVTAYTDFDALKSAINDAKIFQYIKKPWDAGDLKRIIDSAIQVYDLKRNNQRLAHELERKNRELTTKNQELKESDQLKYDFLRIISHEIRTPLNGMKGAVELMELEPEIPEKLAPLLSMAKGSADRLEHLLMLAERITAMRAKRYPLQPCVIPLHQLLNSCCEALAHKAQKKGHELDCTPPSQKCFFGDSDLIELCILQVLDNAIRYSETPCTISLDCKMSDGTLIVTIRDRGRGFSEHVLKNLFKVFITESIEHDSSLGLNLSLIKLITEMHGGETRAYNHPDGGAEVIMSFNDQSPK